MRHDARLSRMLHVLIHMDKRGGRTTSDTIAQMLGTNPVVVRRTMAPLKRAGLVTSDGGAGGGWSLARAVDGVTVREVHEALGSPSVLAIDVAVDHKTCPVEGAVVAELGAVFRATEAFMLERMQDVTLGALAMRASQI
ncbi:transcriptional regulator [Massilia oculi]|uniref:Transcriptional regulator n=2 Tax=Massilia oculi TaxID=945844 RepID=A0A2S2DR29_9BURK|nr:transcriptional regulator [Massilia oculi]